MSYSNIKIESSEIRELKQATGEKTGQKAILKAIRYFLRESKQRNIPKMLEEISFEEGFDPLKLRKHER